MAINNKMGLGTIFGGDIIVKRKFRWHFKGHNERGAELFSHFVRVTHRPTTDNMEETEINYLSNKTWIPGKNIDENYMQFSLHCVMYDDPADAKRDIDNAKFAIPRLDYGSLTLYDGLANEIERWDFDCIEANISRIESVMDGADIDVTVKYIDVVYNCTIPAFIPPK